jgi:hypothetical protein
MSAIIILTIPKALLEKISKNIEGADLNIKLLKCVEAGYSILTKPPIPP